MTVYRAQSPLTRIEGDTRTSRKRNSYESKAKYEPEGRVISAAAQPEQAVQREWSIAAPHARRHALAQEAGISPLLAQVLLNRGVANADEVRTFLNPDFRALHAPDELPGAGAAADLLADASRAGRRVTIYGDYDVDGVTATAILWHGLKLGGADVDYYIPSRFEEGYGLNSAALEKIAAEGGDIVISVDCGITAVEEARRAAELGLTLIISDHHEPGPVLPQAAAIVHPTACETKGPNPHLSGAGVALKIAWALAQRLSNTTRVSDAFREYLLDSTALAALGLIADVVPLTGENRIITTFGLRHLRHTQNPGMRALITVAGLDRKERYDDYDVGFALAPRLNAVGRMGHARLAVDLFTHATAAQAEQIAKTLDAQNRKRQAVEREIRKSAEAMVVERGFNRDGCHAIVLADEKWHPGVIGIVASRLVDRFGRPTVLIALENGVGQGSGRSVRHFPLHEVLAESSELLISHGGHAMAAGLRIKAENIEAFTTAFQAAAGQRLTPRDLCPHLEIDAEVRLDDLRTSVVEQLERMVPFGNGNPRPRLSTDIVELVDAPRVVGKTGSHLQFRVRQGEAYRKAIAFNRGKHAAELAEHRRLRIAFEPIINEWQGRRSVELKVLDWKWAEQ